MAKVRTIVAKHAAEGRRLALLRAGVVLELVHCSALEADERDRCDAWIELAPDQPCEPGWILQEDGGFSAP
jgi:hypothetical protein